MHEIATRLSVCTRCAALTKRIVPQKHVLSEIDSTLARKCKSEGVERVFAVVEYTEPHLQSFREDRD